MGQVEEVVDQQPVVRGERLHPVDGGPGVVAEPRCGGQAVMVGVGRVAHPHPDPRPLLDERAARYVGARRDAVLTGHPGARAARVEAQAVVGALDLVADPLTLGQRELAVRAAVGERHRLAV